MPQGRFGKPPMGVIYNTQMNRPDAALALAALYGFEIKRDSRIGSICVVGSGLKTAIFCDMVGRMYMPGPVRNGNQVLAVGLADVKPLPPDAAWVSPVVDKKNEKGEPLYVHSVERVSDTSLAEAVLLNGAIWNADAAIILSAPATYLAKSLNLNNAKAQYEKVVKRLVIVDSGAPQQDVAALRKVLAEWPAPVFYCPKEVGEGLPFPANALEKAFDWAPHHPVVDAYEAAGKMPYEAPAYDLAATHFAVHPDAGFFQLSEPGSLTVSDDGKISFKPGGGQVRSLKLDPAKKDQLMVALIEALSAKPASPQQRTRPGAQKQDAKTDGAAKPGAAATDPAKPPVIKKDQ